MEQGAFQEGAKKDGGEGTNASFVVSCVSRGICHFFGGVCSEFFWVRCCLFRFGCGVRWSSVFVLISLLPTFA